MAVEFGIEAEQDLHGFAPIRAIARGVEQAQIQRHVLPVIGREPLTAGGASKNFDIDRVTGTSCPLGAILLTKSARVIDSGHGDDGKTGWFDSVSVCGLGWGPSLISAMKPQHSFALFGGQKDDASSFQRPSNLIARRLVHFEPAFGFEAFERGQ